MTADIAAGPLSGQVALVTGAAGGIGAAVARRLAADGATVAVTDLAGADGITLLAEEIGGLAVTADVAVEADVRALIGLVGDGLGPVDLLVANAAAMSMGPVATEDLEQWWRMIDVNLTGTFLLVREVLAGMRAKGAGRVVVMTSEWGVMGWPLASGYSASKSGLVALVKSLGRELAPSGILVNGIAPSVVQTDQLQVDAAAAGVTIEELHRSYAERIPIGRLARPEEIAAVAAYLCGPWSAAMVGQIMQPNGGSTRGRV